MKAKPATGNLTSGVVEHLGRAIITGVHKDSPYLVESDLCDQYGVSRSVLREAVKMLTAKGLLGARPRQGTKVQPEDSWNLLDPDVLRWMLERRLSVNMLKEFTEIRLAIEPEAAALAARRGDAKALKALDQALDRMRAAEKGDDDPLESDIAFHVALLNASGNRFYAKLDRLVAAALTFSIRLTNMHKGVPQASIADHAAIADAIRAGDAASARAAALRILEEAMELINKALAAGGD